MASGRRLLALLAAVERGLSAPATSAAQAERLVDTAYDAFELAQHRACVAQASPDALIRQVVALARSMATLDAALRSSGDQRGTARCLDLSCGMVVDQIIAACMGLQAASMTFRTLQLQPSTAPQAADGSELAAGLVIVFSAGAASLEARRTALLSAAPGSPAAWQAGARLGEFANHQVVAANAGLATVQGIAGGSFNSNVAVTQAFPGWLVSLGRTLQLCSRQSGAAANPRGIRLWAAFASLAVNASLSMELAVRGSPASQQVVAEVLLGCCLPALEAECVASRSGGGRFHAALEQSSEDTAHAGLLVVFSDEPDVAQQALLDTLPFVLAKDTNPFHGQLLAHLANTPGAAQAALRAAASIVSALPERPPAGGDAAADWQRGHRQAAQLYCLLLEAEALPGTPAAQLSQGLEQLQLVPHALAAMRQLTSSRQPGQPAWVAEDAMFTYSVLLAHCSQQMRTLQQQGSNLVFTSPTDTIRWVAAAEAALRALPLLSSLAQQPETARPLLQNSAEMFCACARSMLLDLWVAPASGLHAWAQRLLRGPELRNPAPITAEDAAEAAAQLWQLQCTSSCALHHLAADGRLAALGLPDTRSTLGAMLAALFKQFVAGHVCMQLAWGGSRGVLRAVPPASTGTQLAEHVSGRRIQALCFTTWAAIQLVAARPRGRKALLCFEGVAALMGILSELADTVGFGVADMLHSVVHRLIANQASRPVAERQAVLEPLFRMLMDTVAQAVRQPWVAAALAGSGVLAQFVALGKSPDLMHMLIDNWGNRASGALASLKRLARTAVSDLAGSGEAEPAGEVAAQLQVALAALDAAISALEHAEAAFQQATADSLQGADPSGAVSCMRGYVSSQHIGDDVLRCAAEVGAALRRYQQLPAQQTAAQVQLALAAAARGCSNLACANLEGSLARELEEGKPNQLCSACKVARYCCSACQAEDWRRGGHRRVCRLLKAANAAQAQQQPG